MIGFKLFKRKIFEQIILSLFNTILDYQGKDNQINQLYTFIFIFFLFIKLKMKYGS